MVTRQAGTPAQIWQYDTPVLSHDVHPWVSAHSPFVPHFCTMASPAPRLPHCIVPGTHSPAHAPDDPQTYGQVPHDAPLAPQRLAVWLAYGTHVVPLQHPLVQVDELQTGTQAPLEHAWLLPQGVAAPYA
jgi:hypothetical protein